MVGEIGIDRREYLYDLLYWEIALIIRGYFRRDRSMWSATRWQTYNLMCVQADTKKAGINSPKDLIKFPWEKEEEASVDLPTSAEIERMQRMMREENARAEKIRQQQSNQ